MKKPVSLDTALHERAGEIIIGTMFGRILNGRRWKRALPNKGNKA